MVLPVQSPQQRQAALAKAAEARTARRELLTALTASQISLAEILGRQDDIARRTKVEAVLRALPGYGRAKTAALMTDCGIDPRAVASAGWARSNAPNCSTPSPPKTGRPCNLTDR